MIIRSEIQKNEHILPEFQGREKEFSSEDCFIYLISRFILWLFSPAEKCQDGFYSYA